LTLANISSLELWTSSGEPDTKDTKEIKTRKNGRRERAKEEKKKRRKEEKKKRSRVPAKTKWP
jgi:hypothetical protein